MPTIFPAFHAERACIVGSYLKYRMIILFGQDWPRKWLR